MENSKKSIEQELDELTSVYKRGGGYGDPDAEREADKRIDLLKHKQMHAISRRNSFFTALNVLLAAINIGVLIYQVFFR